MRGAARASPPLPRVCGGTFDGMLHGRHRQPGPDVGPHPQREQASRLTFRNTREGTVLCTSTHKERAHFVSKTGGFGTAGLRVWKAFSRRPPHTHTHLCSLVCLSLCLVTPVFLVARVPRPASAGGGPGGALPRHVRHVALQLHTPATLAPADKTSCTRCRARCGAVHAHGHDANSALSAPAPAPAPGTCLRRPPSESHTSEAVVWLLLLPLSTLRVLQVL